MPWLLFLFLVVPTVELILLFRVGAVIGGLPTLALIVATGVVGASLARQEGLAVLSRARAKLEKGEAPSEILQEGLLILIAGVLLITPGFLTDIFGLACLFPITRRGMLSLMGRGLKNAASKDSFRVHSFGSQPPTTPPNRGTGGVKDVPEGSYEVRKGKGGEPDRLKDDSP